MTDEIKIWAIDSSSGEVTSVEPTNQTDTEKLLEDTLVKHPKMLMSGLTLVGRQTPTAGGPLDLLGIDSEGQLVVFELKRGTLTRDAITQIIDYSSYLESLADIDLAAYIAEQSGKNGINKIDDFEEWYSQHFAQQPLATLKPVQMILVGLGTDDNATRMVNFLAKSGVSLSILNFYGYSHESNTLLARQMQAEPPTKDVNVSSNWKARMAAVTERAALLEISDLFNEIVENFTKIGSRTLHPLTHGYAFYRRSIRLPNHDWSFNVPYAIRFTEDRKIRITFLPIAIHLCGTEFTDMKENISFAHERPPNAPSTNEVQEQWYCVLDKQGWKEQKDTLLAFASAVYKAWDEAVRNTS